MESNPTLRVVLRQRPLACSVWHWRTHQGSRERFQVDRFQLCIKKSFEAAQNEQSCDIELPVSRGMQADQFHSCIQTDLWEALC